MTCDGWNSLSRDVRRRVKSNESSLGDDRTSRAEDKLSNRRRFSSASATAGYPIEASERDAYRFKMINASGNDEPKLLRL